MNQQEMHDKILAMVREYCDTYSKRRNRLQITQ